MDDIIMSQKRKGQTPEESKAGALQERRNPFRFWKGMAKKPNDTWERGESNGIRRDILPVRGTRRGAVTETIKVIAIRKSEFQVKKANRLKSAIGFWTK